MARSGREGARGPGKELALTDDLSPVIGADLLLLNVTADELVKLHSMHPDLDLRGLLVDHHPPPPGMKSVSTPRLAPADLVAFVRRGRG